MTWHSLVRRLRLSGKGDCRSSPSSREYRILQKRTSFDGRPLETLTMRRPRTTLAPILLACLMLLTAGYAQTTEKPDLSKQPTLYVVGYAHLDTEWRWEYPQVISEYLRKTMDDNFILIDKYPHYIFNFSGANRYRFMKEYFPADYARLKKYVDEGRWFPAGSSMEEGDV